MFSTEANTIHGTWLTLIRSELVIMNKMSMVKIIEIILHLNQHVEPDSRCGRQSQQRVPFALSLLHNQPRLHDFNALIPLSQANNRDPTMYLQMCSLCHMVTLHFRIP